MSGEVPEAAYGADGKASDPMRCGLRVWMPEVPEVPEVPDNEMPEMREMPAGRFVGDVDGRMLARRLGSTELFR
ncbi:hypothetical protein E4U54_006780, partial [Claviceps lovelessii]